jgi:septum formation protein
MIILASKSAARNAMLRHAGITFQTQHPEFDETGLKSLLTGITTRQLAEKLAIGKALAVSEKQKENFVIGSDQTLEFGGTLMSKPNSIAEARQHLKSLRGAQHQLHSAVALAHNAKVLWSTCETVTLKMRHFTDSFLDTYLEIEKSEILHCVGAYRFEGLGLQLFEQVEGSYHAVLGMPLLPLLQKLREHGLIAS